VISNAGTGSNSVKALVFIGAFAPEASESASNLSGRYEGSTLGETLGAVPLPAGGSDLYIRQERYHAQFAADSSPREAAILAVTQRPITESALTEPSGEPAWKTIPSWLLFGAEDKNIRTMVRRPSAVLTSVFAGGAPPSVPQLWLSCWCCRPRATWQACQLTSFLGCSGEATRAMLPVRARRAATASGHRSLHPARSSGTS
jgi:hypothetical protein